MQDSPRLTHNGVLYLTLGFRQEYLLQVLTLHRQQQDLQLVLYDGLAYIGALFRPSLLRPTAGDDRGQLQEQARRAAEAVRELDVVRITPVLARPNEPIVIQRLEVAESGLAWLLGQEAITLEELMRRREFRRKPAIREEREEEEISLHSRKITKLFDEASIEKSNSPEAETKAEILVPQSLQGVIVLDDSPADPEGQIVQETEKMVVQGIPNEEPLAREPAIQRGTTSLESFESVPGLAAQKDKQDEITQKITLNVQEKPHILEIEEEKQSTIDDSIEIAIKDKAPAHSHSIPNSTNIIIDADSVPASAPVSHKLSKSSSGEGTLRICDLYQRMHRFRLLCRVNHLSQFTSQRGTFCTKLHLVDQSGDEITCMIFQKTPPPTNSRIAKGKTYIFSDGEVSKEEDGLSISVPVTGIVEQHRFLPSFVPSKMMRLGDVQKQESSGYYMERAINLDTPAPPRKQQPINVCGIFQGFREDPKTAKNHFRVTGVLCDPDLEIAINFGLLVDELASFPSEGAVVSLHNVIAVEDERTLSLEGGKNSYILSEAGNAHEYFADLLRSSLQGEWRRQEFRNLSLITYVTRTVSQLKLLLSRVTEHEFAYSEIDCRISSIRERRSYEACLNCRREVKAEAGLFNYCFTCRKPSKHGPRFLFDLEVSDSTGCLSVDLNSDRLQEYVGMTAEEFAACEKSDRTYYLDLCVYKGIVVRVKSERVVGGVNHKAVSASKTNHQQSLAQIRAMAIEEKTKYVSTW